MTTPPTPQDEWFDEIVMLDDDLTPPRPPRKARKLTCFTDEGLTAHDAAIRQQVAEEIAEEIQALCRVHPTRLPFVEVLGLSSDTRTARNVRDAVAAQAAAIARSHSTQPGEETK